MQVGRLSLVVRKLLMVKVRGITGISKIEFFNFSGTERVKLRCGTRYLSSCLNLKYKLIYMLLLLIQILDLM